METHEPNAPEPLPPLGETPPEPAPERPKAYRAPSKEPLAQIADALKEITPVLDAADMEPDPGRTDWSRARGQIDAAYALFKGEVLPVIDDALAPIPAGNDLRLKVSTNVAWIGAEIASLLFASKRTDDAQRLLLQVARIAPTSAPDGMDIRAELEAAGADTAAWVELMRARYLQRGRQWDEGDRVLRAAKGKATSPTIKAAITKQLGGARPITSAPPLFRLNGCGASIYGERDRRPDGSYVTTYCVALLFIPVWPISAYRVVDHGNGSYGFLAKEPLSSFARGYRWVAAGLVGVWLASMAVTSYLSDPHRLAANAFAETRESTASMAPDQALATWSSLANTHGWSLTGDARDTAGSEMVRLVLDAVPSPMTSARVGEVESALARYRALPELAHGPAQERAVLDRVLAWQADVGAATQDDAVASLRVLDALGASDGASTGALAEAEAFLATSGRGSLFATAPEIAERRASLHRAMAEQLATEWPLEAIDHWAQAGDAASLERMGQVLSSLTTSRSLLLEAEAPVSSYLAATSAGTEPRDTIAIAMDGARTMQNDEGRSLALASGEVRALEAVLETYADDQETIAALANAKRQAGDLAGAHRLLDPLGEPGRLIASIQAVRASLLSDEGHLDEAAALLSHSVHARLPGFQAAQRAYRSAFDARTSALEAQVRGPFPPIELEERLRDVPEWDEVRGREIVQSWFLEQITNDTGLAALRDALDARSGVVPSVLQLAMLELRLGNDTTGEVRDGHFREAERLFLAIRDEAAGLPSFHLGLGQVYHRLGRAAEGDAEIGQVLAMGDPALELEAAHTYRDLGLSSQAQEIAQRVYDGGVAPHAQNAAMLMSLLAATLEDEELWLSRADQSSDFVQINLLQARARRLARDGDLRQAETLFGQVADRFLRLSSHDTAALNNAAIALQQRYACSGNPAHLARSVELMEQAQRLAPESGLTAANLAELLAFAGNVAVLDRFVHTRELHLEGSTASELVDWMVSGSQHDAVLAALREEPRLRRALEVLRQAEALSPQRTAAYDTELDLLERIDDAAGIAALAERVGHVTNLETSQMAEQAARWQRGELDESVRPTYDSNIALLRERADGLRGGHAPTHAAVLVLLARQLAERTQITRDPADFEAAEAALAEAETVTPGWGSAQAAGWARVGRELLVLAQSNATVQSIVAEGWRSTSLGVLCLRLSSEPSARDAVRGDAALREGVAMLHGSRNHGMQTLACAALAGDEAVGAEARAQTETPQSRSAFVVETTLAPWSHYEELATLRP